MFGIIMAIMFIIIGVIAGIVLISGEYKTGGVLSMIAGFVVAIVFIALASCAVIPTGYTGIVTTFGKVSNTTLDAGINWIAPWQSVVKMDNRVQKQTLNLQCFSSDIQEVNINFTINYQIDKTNAMTIYQTIGTDYFNVIIAPNVTETTKTVLAKYTAENLIGNREELSAQITSDLTAALAAYNIQVVSTAIEDMDFTDAFTDAVEAKQVAAQNKLQAEIEQEQKTMEQNAAAERAVIDANAAAEVAKIQADAAEYAGQKEAAKNKAISESLTGELINYYYIQQWNGNLPESYVGSDNVSTIVGLN